MTRGQFGALLPTRLLAFVGVLLLATASLWAVGVTAQGEWSGVGELGEAQERVAEEDALRNALGGMLEALPPANRPTASDWKALLAAKSREELLSAFTAPPTFTPGARRPSGPRRFLRVRVQGDASPAVIAQWLKPEADSTLAWSTVLVLTHEQDDGVLTPPAARTGPAIFRERLQQLGLGNVRIANDTLSQGELDKLRGVLDGNLADPGLMPLLAQRYGVDFFLVASVEATSQSAPTGGLFNGNAQGRVTLRGSDGRVLHEAQVQRGGRSQQASTARDNARKAVIQALAEGTPPKAFGAPDALVGIIVKAGATQQRSFVAACQPTLQGSGATLLGQSMDEGTLRWTLRVPPAAIQDFLQKARGWETKVPGFLLAEEGPRRLVFAALPELVAESTPAGPSPASEPAGEEDPRDLRWNALLVGINEYSKMPNATLTTPIADVKAIGEVLRNEFNFAQVDVLLDEQATTAAIRESFVRLGRTMKPEDNLVIYFAGHGNLANSGVGVWITADSRDDWDGISDMEIIAALRMIAARRVLLISDSCYSGSFLTQSGAAQKKKRALGRVWHENVKAPTDEIPAPRLGKRLARQVISSGGLEEVPDQGVGECAAHSPFACVLVQELRAVEPGSLMTASVLFSRIRKGIVLQEEYEGPRFGNLGQGYEGEFAFFRRRE